MAKKVTHIQIEWDDLEDYILVMVSKMHSKERNTVECIDGSGKLITGRVEGVHINLITIDK